MANATSSSYVSVMLKPQLSLNGPGNNKCLLTNYTVTGSVDTITTLEGIYISVDNGTFTKIAPSQTFSYTITVSPGSHNIKAYAKDILGNCSDTKEFTSDFNVGYSMISDALDFTPTSGLFSISAVSWAIITNDSQYGGDSLIMSGSSVYSTLITTNNVSGLTYLNICTKYIDYYSFNESLSIYTNNILVTNVNCNSSWNQYKIKLSSGNQEIKFKLYGLLWYTLYLDNLSFTFL